MSTVDINDWTTAEHVLTTWPSSMAEWSGCSSMPTKFVLETPLTDPQAEIEAAACHQSVVARVVTRWPDGDYGNTDTKLKPRKWPVCAEHLAWHLASDVQRNHLIIGQEPVPSPVEPCLLCRWNRNRHDRNRPGIKCSCECHQ